MLFKMQTLTIFALVLAAVAAQRGVSKSAPGLPPLIVMQTSEVNPDGSFRYSFETDNGIRAEESGYLSNPGSPGEAQTVQGSYSYTAPDGTPIVVTYTADENGFNAQGDHLPVAPEIPALIAKALAYNAAKARADGGDDYQSSPSPRPRPSTTRRIPIGVPQSGMAFGAPPGQLGFASGTEL